MSAFYTKLSATALSMLTRYGGTICLEGPPHRDVKGMRVRTITHTLGDSGVQVGDEEFLLEASAEPRRGTVLVFNNERFIIMQVDAIQPADVPVAWYAYGRSG